MSPVWTIIVLALVMIGGLTLVKLLGVWRRGAGARKLGDVPLVREEQAVDLKVLLFRTRTWQGMDPRHTHPARGDLLLTSDRFILSTDRGILADVGPTRGRRFRSVRCTGPGRLVIEGDIPQVGREPGQYRFELVLDDAIAWAQALQPFVEADAESSRFGTFGAPST